MKLNTTRRYYYYYKGRGNHNNTNNTAQSKGAIARGSPNQEIFYENINSSAENIHVALTKSCKR